MKFFTTATIAALAAMVAAKPLGIRVRDAQPLEVTLSTSGTTGVKATVKNNGAEGLNLFRRGTVLDDLDIEKVNVFDGQGAKIQYSGLAYSLQRDNLTDAVFLPIGSGETIEIELDPSTLHDLSSGGKFEITAEGLIPIAPLGSTVLSGEGIRFKSNTLELDVDSTVASKSFKAHQAKMRRSIIADDCQGDQRAQVETAFNDCRRISQAAAGVVRDGDAGKVEEYFKASDADTRNFVAGRFDSTAAACGTDGGDVNVYCSTPEPCDEGILAYAFVGGTEVRYCPAWFGLPQLTTECHGQDKMGTALHEFTHSGIYDPPTSDFAYFYENLINLSPEEAKNNADTYSVFANAIEVGC